MRTIHFEDGDTHCHGFIFTEIMTQEQGQLFTRMKLEIFFRKSGTITSCLHILYFTYLHIYDEKTSRNCMQQEGRD